MGKAKKDSKDGKPKTRKRKMLGLAALGAVATVLFRRNRRSAKPEGVWRDLGEPRA